MPSTGDAASMRRRTSSPPPFIASSSRFSSARRSSSSACAFFAAVSGVAFSTSAACWSCCSRSRRMSNARGPVTASMRRTPAATPVSLQDVEEPDLRRVADVRAAAQLHREPRDRRRRARRRRTSRRTAPSRPSPRASVYGFSLRARRPSPPRSRGSRCASISASASAFTGPWCVKSKRRRSGATSEPAWCTCSPSTSRSAACSRCVAVWLRSVSLRRSLGTRATRRPERERRRSACRTPRCARRPCARRRRPRASRRRRSRRGRRPGRPTRRRTASRAAGPRRGRRRAARTAVTCVSISTVS